MQCEVCGKGEGEYIAEIEGARLHVCGRCSKLGKILYSPPTTRHAPQRQQKVEEELELVEGYGKRIRDARTKMGISLSVLAERINEKESFLERIEKEKTLPDERAARLLEKELGIKLLITFSAGAGETKKGERKELTLGDIIEVETAEENEEEE
jgi:putative transcription factor